MSYWPSTLKSRRSISSSLPVMGFTVAVVFATCQGSSLAWATTKTKEIAVATDAFSYLDDSSNARAKDWVRQQNDRTLAELERDPRFARHYQLALDAEAPSTSGGNEFPERMWLYRGHVYELWLGGGHQRGVLRSTQQSAFIAGKPDWQVLLDVDAMSAAEAKEWTLSGMQFSPSGRRCLLRLSLAGSIRTAWREFDLGNRTFVKEGFQIPASTIMNVMVWKNEDTVLVSSDFGPGTLSSAGAPIVIKQWSRGNSLDDGKDVFRGNADDVSAIVSDLDAEAGGTDEGPGGSRVVHFARADRSNNTTWWRLDHNDRLEQMQAPLSNTTPVLYRDQYIVVLRQDWNVGGRTWKQGSAIAIPTADITKSNPRIYSVFSPVADTSVMFVAGTTSEGILLLGSWLGYGRLWRAVPKDGSWVVDPVPLPDHGVIKHGVADVHSDTAFITYESFLQPATLYQVDVRSNRVTPVLNRAPQFDGRRFVTEQQYAKSSDGAEVPYTIVRPLDLKFDGRAATLVVGYGAHGAINFPYYSASLGKLWLDNGGVYVSANVRGGHERGPAWAVRRAERQHTYDDMIAVTEDLVRRKVTAPKRIGFMGHSSGGLLAGVMLTQRPDLFGAVVLEAPVLDQLRFDLWALGSRMYEEYGSPDIPQERAFLERTSPFQNLIARPDAPKPFLITSTTDETVFPAHARRFAAKMQSLKMPFLFYETAEGGHGLAATPVQRARLEALIYTYLARQLFDQPTGS